MNDNLDLFNKFTAEIFSSLLNSFPVPQHFPYGYFDAATPESYWDDPNSDECQENSAMQEVIASTFNFLKDNGYLLYSSEQEGFGSVQLTEKALIALKQKPESLESVETTGQRIIDAVKDGSPGMISSAVSSVFTAGINALTNFSG